MPKNVIWIKEAASSFQPEHNMIVSAQDNSYTYDYLIIAPRIQLNWSKVEGLTETISKNGVTINYSHQYAPYTYECLKNIKPGDTILFTAPSTPTKCGGAP